MKYIYNTSIEKKLDIIEQGIEKLPQIMEATGKPPVFIDGLQYEFDPKNDSFLMAWGVSEQQLIWIWQGNFWICLDYPDPSKVMELLVKLIEPIPSSFSGYKGFGPLTDRYLTVKSSKRINLSAFR